MGSLPRRLQGVDRARIVAAVAAASVLAVTGAALVASQASAQRDLQERFRLRAELGSRFAASFVQEVVGREIASAELFLAADPPSHARVREVTHTFGFEASVLLDAQGRFISGEPFDASLVGQTLTERYEHLRVASEERRYAVSNVVPSASRGIPVVAIAVPFEGRNGPRVFSGAFDITTTPLDNYLRSLVPIEGGTAYLVDGAGNVIASNASPLDEVQPLARVRPALARAAGASTGGSFQGEREPEYFTRRGVADTPWTLVASAPVRTLFEPVSGAGRWVPWVLYAAFAGLVAAVALLVIRLQEKRREIERAAQAQRDFQAMAGHELRSPLAALVGGLGVLVERDFDAERRAGLLDIALRSANHLRSLIDDLLVLHEAESGVLAADTVPTDAAALVREVAEEFDPMGREAGVVLELDLDAETPPALIDPRRMKQVLWNLLGNAAKFTPAGGRVELSLAGGPDGWVTFRVRDDGPGIAPEEAGRVFDTFFRSAAKAKNEVAGTGLGLAIARRLVEAQSGRIDVESEPGEGATFIVTVPAAAPG